ncbi:hypothetical protein GCM10009744_46770 [Kribbella alba]|uniref:Resolvase/invertase-type recombinase catalytic domain-containing protein n=1 Tax=Kribbella alba TaxID=190197 RepID=A0ABN2FKC7_9ACTN
MHAKPPQSCRAAIRPSRRSQAFRQLSRPRYSRHLRCARTSTGRAEGAARVTVEELTEAEVKLGGQVHDPNDPIGRLLFNVLAMIAEYESDLIRMRTREGMEVAKAKGRRSGLVTAALPASRANWYRRVLE